MVRHVLVQLDSLRSRWWFWPILLLLLTLIIPWSVILLVVLLWLVVEFGLTVFAVRRLFFPAAACAAAHPLPICRGMVA